MSALHTQKANRTAWNDIHKRPPKNPATNPLVTALQEMRFGRLGRQIDRAAWWQPKHPQQPSAATQEHTK